MIDTSTTNHENAPPPSPSPSRGEGEGGGDKAIFNESKIVYGKRFCIRRGV
jgi:hypothetical protein